MQSPYRWIVKNVIYSIGSVLVTGSKYGTTKLWDMKEHKCTCTFEDCHSDEITCVIMKVSYKLTMLQCLYKNLASQ